jgi:hypothetical protein
MTPMGIERMAFWLVVQCPNQLRHCVLHYNVVSTKCTRKVNNICLLKYHTMMEYRGMGNKHYTLVISAPDGHPSYTLQYTLKMLGLG